eukprot:Sdes_comp20921_c0_seq2m18319
MKYLDGKPMLRNGVTGDWIGTFEGHKGAVWSARLDNNATKAATGSADFTAKIWDATTGLQVLSFPHQHIVRRVEFFQGEGEKLLTACQDRKLRVFDLARPDAEPLVLSGHTSNIKCVFIVENTSSTQLLSAAENEKDDQNMDIVRLWDLRTSKPVRAFSVAPLGSIMDINNSSLTNLLTFTHGHHVSFCDMRTFSQVKLIDVKTPVFSTSQSPVDSNKFVTGGQDFYLHMFNYETELEEQVHKGHHGPVHCVRFSPDGELYASGSEDGTLRLWQTNIGKEYGLWRYSPSNSKSTQDSPLSLNESEAIEPALA